MASLYEINQQILECIDLETGEILDDSKYNELELAKEEKLENIALYYKNMLSEAEALKAEKNAFAEREKQARAKAESLKKLLDNELGGNKFETTRVKISYRKSTSLEYDGESEVPDEYLRHVPPEIDKTKVKDAIKNGEVVEGFSMKENNNIQIK
jgi:hypothetical protein